MSVEKPSERLKFDINGRYTKSEFIEVCRDLATSLDIGAGLATILLEEIRWAEGLGEEAVIGWFEGQDGTTYPYVDRGTLMVDSDGGLMEVNGQSVDDWLEDQGAG